MVPPHIVLPSDPLLANQWPGTSILFFLELTLFFRYINTEAHYRNYVCILYITISTINLVFLFLL